MKKTTFTLAAASLILVSYSASSADDARIRLATTTSTYDSGLLDYLLPKFEQDTGYKVDVIATGTGKALKMGERKWRCGFGDDPCTESRSQLC